MHRMADGVGFEPTRSLHPCWFSRPVPSTTRPPILSFNQPPSPRRGGGQVTGGKGPSARSRGDRPEDSAGLRHVDGRDHQGCTSDTFEVTGSRNRCSRRDGRGDARASRSWRRALARSGGRSAPNPSWSACARRAASASGRVSVRSRNRTAERSGRKKGVGCPNAKNAGGRRHCGRPTPTLRPRSSEWRRRQVPCGPQARRLTIVPGCARSILLVVEKS